MECKSAADNYTKAYRLSLNIGQGESTQTTGGNEMGDSNLPSIELNRKPENRSSALLQDEKSLFDLSNADDMGGMRTNLGILK